MQKPGMLIGQKGVKYGLHVRQPKQEQEKKPAGRLAAFSADSDDEEDVGAQIQRQAARKVADSKVQEMYAAALAEDPSAFDYDGVYDSIQEEKLAPKMQDRAARQPKYIASLLEQAQLRKREQEITNERIMLKERQKEDHMYENQEKFITSAYRKKLEEDKKWQESQRLKELEEERNDVKKLGHMNNFFHNLTKNVALGGTANQPQRSQQPAAEQAADAEMPAVGAAGGSSSAAGDAQQQQEQQQQRRQSASHGAPAAAAEGEEEEGEQAWRQRHGGSYSADERNPPHDGAAVEVPAAAPAVAQQQQWQHAKQPEAAAHSRGEHAAQHHHQQQQQQQEPQGQTVGGKRKNDDSTVAAARERYLARKRQQQLGA